MFIERYGNYLNISNSKGVRGFSFYIEYIFEKDIQEFINYFTKLNKSNKLRVHNKKNKKFEYYLYYAKVLYYTEINSLSLENINLLKNNFCIDHIIPIRFGYSYGIDFKIISSLNNLQILSLNENLKKSTKITDKAIEILNIFEIDYYSLIKNKKKTS